MSLDEQKFRVGRKALELLEQSGFEARFAGGCVRDRIMKITPKDYDIATTAMPEQVRSIFEQKSARVIPTGIDHGTMTVVLTGVSLEITTLRKDVKTDGRHAVVEFGGASFEDDASRRDFTANAMFEDRKGEIYDFFDGREDIRKKTLRFVGDPSQRIKEDYLRILRFYRFWARLGFKADAKALSAIAELQDGLKQVSQERITGEILETLSYPDIASPLKHLKNSGIFSLVLPELPKLTPKIQSDLKSCAKIEQKSVGMARLARLINFGLEKGEIEVFAQRLKLSNEQKNRLVLLVTGKDLLKKLGKEPADAMELIDLCETQGGTDSFDTLFGPFWKIACPSKNLNRLFAVEKKSRHVRLAAIPVTGKDLGKDLGIKPSPEMGRVLAQLKRDFRNQKRRTKTEGLALAKSLSL